MADLARVLTAIRPESIVALWDDISNTYGRAPVGNNGARNHSQLEFLSMWANDGDIAAFFKAKRIKDLVKNIHDEARSLGMEAQEQVERFYPNTPHINFEDTCTGCCPPYAGCRHGDDSPHWIESRLLFPSPEKNEQLCAQVHKTVCLISFAISLLSWRSDDGDILRGQETLLDELLVPLTLVHVQCQITYPMFLPIVGLVDNCSVLLPKLARKSLALLSLTMSRRPSKFLPLLDPEPLIASIDKYSSHVLDLFTGCKVEAQFAVSETLSYLPLLYYLGDWKSCAQMLAASRLPAILVMLLCQVCHSASETPTTRTKYPTRNK